MSGVLPIINIDIKSEHIVRALDRIVDVAADWLNDKSDPQRIFERAEAKKAAAKLSAEGRADAALAKEKGRQELEKLREKGEDRALARENRRQRNRESVIANAALFLREDSSKETPDEDWVYRFFGACEDIGNDEMQVLWGKILAGEVAQPGTFSYRTLDCVRLMRREDADLFTRLCSYVWSLDDNKPVAIAGNMHGASRYTRNTGLALPGPLVDITPNLSVSDMLHLRTLGLIECAFGSGFTRAAGPSKEDWVDLNYFRREVRLFLPKDARALEVGNVVLTSVGMELAAIAGASGDDDYFGRISALWLERGIEIEERRSDQR